MSYFSQLGKVPEQYMKAADFAKSDDTVFTFGRTFEDHARVQDLLSKGYAPKLKDSSHSSRFDVIRNKFWALGRDPETAYHRMRTQSISPNNHNYVVFGLLRENIDGIETEIEHLESDVTAHIHLPDVARDKRNWWVPSVVAVIDKQGGILLPRNIKGLVDMNTGEVTQNPSFSLEERVQQ